MEIGDLIEIIRCPFDGPNVFGYKNGDIAIVVDLNNEAWDTHGYECAEIFLPVKEISYIVPIIYMKKIGD